MGQQDLTHGERRGIMKTRIVYPQLWLDEKFYSCSLETKVLFNYLINNIYLGLSRYTRISERKISFETGLNVDQITTAKSELEKLRWCFFKGEWIYHNHNCAYVDYKRNLNVEKSKQNEIDAVPYEIKRYFDECCLNGVRTPFTQKPKTINHKPKTINQKGEKDFLQVNGYGALKQVAEQLKGINAT